MASSPQPAGCVRLFLILILIFVTLSGGYLMLNLTSNKFVPQQEEPALVAFTHVHLFTGEDTLPGLTTVVVRGDSILCVGNDCQVPAGATTIDGEGGALMPALADAAFYFYLPTQESFDLSPQEQFFDYIKHRPEVRRSFLKNGVTAFLSPGDTPGNIRDVQKQIDQSKLAGPAVWMMGPFLTAPGGHPVGDWFDGDETLIKQACVQINDEAAAVKAVNDLAAAGTNGIAISYDPTSAKLPVLSLEVVRTLVTSAKGQGLLTTIRVSEPQKLAEAAALRPEIVYYAGTEVPDTALLRAVSQAGTTVCLLAANPEDSLRPAAELVQAFFTANIPMVAGSGWQPNTYAGAGLLAQMRTMISPTLSPLYLLKANTRNLYLTLHQDHQGGWITPGHTTDVVLLRSVPWRSDSLPWKVRLVMRKGLIYERE